MQKPNKATLGISVVALAILLLWSIWASSGVQISHRFLNGANPSESSSWGDSFGGFNALVSAFAFAGVIATVIIQGKALQQQQNDIQRQRADQHRQQFDSSFFLLIGLMREIRSEVFFKYSEEYVQAVSPKSIENARGPEALSRAGREVYHWIREKNKTRTINDQQLARIYSLRVHSRSEQRLGPYFRIIYTILRRIYEDPIMTDKEKEQYGNLVRSQLQSREILLLALNGLTPLAGDLRSYLIHFRMMKYLSSKTMQKILLTAYPEEAFTARD